MKKPPKLASLLMCVLGEVLNLSMDIQVLKEPIFQDTFRVLQLPRSTDSDKRVGVATSSSLSPAAQNSL